MLVCLPCETSLFLFLQVPTWALYIFSNYLLDVQRIGNMGTSFFTPLWQIECTSLVIATLKENNNFLYPQKKVYVTFETCRSSRKTSDIASWRKETLKRRPCSHLHPPPSVIKPQSHKCLGKTFPKLPRRLLFCKRVNASQMQTTLDWISELICSALTCMLEVAKFWYTPLD